MRSSDWSSDVCSSDLSKSQEVVDLWNEILPDDFIQRPRMSRIYYEGKYYSYPLRAFEALWNLGIVRSALCMASYAKAKLLPNRQVRSFEDWTINQFGRNLSSIFFKNYHEKVWGMPCYEMSAAWAAPIGRASCRERVCQC